MKKKYALIVGILFTISLVFIVTGTLVVKNSFYIVNNTSEELNFRFQNDDGETIDIAIETGDSILIFEKQFLSFNSKPKSVGYFIELPIFVGSIHKYEDNLWKIRTNRRENVYYYIVEPNSELILND